MTVMEAIARFEGWGKEGTIPTRDNNPGDIVAGTFTEAHGASGHAGRFATFPTPEAGFAALRSLLCAHYSGMTLAAALTKYAPPIENNTNAYLAGVCKMTDLTPETILTEELIG